MPHVANEENGPYKSNNLSWFLNENLDLQILIPICSRVHCVTVLVRGCFICVIRKIKISFLYCIIRLIIVRQTSLLNISSFFSYFYCCSLLFFLYHLTLILKLHHRQDLNQSKTFFLFIIQCWFFNLILFLLFFYIQLKYCSLYLQPQVNFIQYPCFDKTYLLLNFQYVPGPNLSTLQ